jgi:hypothetical protein
MFKANKCISKICYSNYNHSLHYKNINFRNVGQYRIYLRQWNGSLCHKPEHKYSMLIFKTTSMCTPFSCRYKYPNGKWKTSISIEEITKFTTDTIDVMYNTFTLCFHYKISNRMSLWESSVCVPGLESREYDRRDPLRWPGGTPFPQKLALTSPTSGGRSVCIVSSRTKATEFSFFSVCVIFIL